MELMIEVPRRALIDLLILAETAEDLVRAGEASPVLADALRGAMADVRSYVLASV
jgi:hypothetical protein